MTDGYRFAPPILYDSELCDRCHSEERYDEESAFDGDSESAERKQILRPWLRMTGKEGQDDSDNFWLMFI
jgi:hypothetical protein